MRHPNCQAEDRLLVEQGVNHPALSEPRGELLGDAIDAALACHVLAHQDDVVMREHEVGQRPVDEPRHDLRRLQRRRVAAERGRACIDRRPVICATLAARRDDRRHHLRCGPQAGALDRERRDPADPGVSLMIDGKRTFGGERPGFGEQPDRMQQRIFGLLGLDLLARQIGRRHVRAGVAVQPDRADVQERGFAAPAHMIGGFQRDPVGVVQVEPIAREIAQARLLRERVPDPADRRPGRDADAVILANEQQRQRDVLVAGPLRRIERALRGRVIGRRVAERTDDDRVVGQDLVFGRLPARREDRIGRAKRLG